MPRSSTVSVLQNKERLAQGEGGEISGFSMDFKLEQREMLYDKQSKWFILAVAPEVRHFMFGFRNDYLKFKSFILNGHLIFL